MSRAKLYAPLLAGAVLIVSACGSSSSSSTPPTSISSSGSSSVSSSGSPSGSTSHGSGPVDVFYAGSLVTLMNKVVGPGFHSASGYTFTGFSGDSGTLANEVKGKTQQGDVFISASPAKDQLLEGAANGNWVNWYARFATSKLVLGYNPNSKFAQALKTKPWYDVVTEPGFRLGRTDPTTDPKGALAVKALAAAAPKAPGLKKISSTTSNVYAENTLVGELQSGQLDAGFFYSVEAAAAKIHTVPLAGVPSNLDAVYTVTILDHAPHEAGAEAFVKYLLGPQGTAALKSQGMTVTQPPTVSGPAPTSLQGVLSGA